MPFSVYIDESGEVGLTKIRSGDSAGASPYFVLGAAVFQPASEILARKVMADFKSKIRNKSWTHATDLKHAEKVLLARSLGRLPVRYFAVISNKSTLHEYKDSIENNPQKFYNKCLKYLLEKICDYLLKRGANADDLSFILEQRNHDYDAMYRYLEKVKNNPHHEESKSLRILNPFAISRMAKGTDELLNVADFIAHAVYQLGNKSEQNYFIPETKYFLELSSRFAGDQSGRIVGVGLKCIHSLEKLELDADVYQIVSNSRAKLPRM